MSATKMLRAAQEIDFNSIKNITQTTIWSIYPKYYPKGAVQFFSDYHSDERIKTDIGSGKVFLIEGEEVIIGTVTVIDNEINRLFVLPDYQGKGYGGALMDFAEEMIGRNYDHIILDASLPGKQMYIKRNYVVKKYDMIETENGDYLCYDTMEKFM
jgi:GNAT superfamily N-acetyltransferase